MRKLICILLVVLLLTAVAGCSTAGEIVDKVAQAAMEELKVQLQSTFEQNKIEVLQVKTAIGKLNDEGSSLQLFFGFLVRSENPQQIQAVTEAMQKMFPHAGCAAQTGAAIESPYLVHKTLSFDADKVADPANCYLVYLYIPDFAADLPEFTIPAITLPG